MIVPMPRAGEGLDGLDFSLKPPKWLRNAVSSVTNAIGIRAEVPTPAGPIAVDTRDPQATRDSVEAVADRLRRTTVTIGPREQPTRQPMSEIVEQIPGGWLTIGFGAAALLFLLSRRR